MLEFLKFTTISETEINFKAVDNTLPAPSYFKETSFCDSRVLRPLCHFMEAKLRASCSETGRPDHDKSKAFSRFSGVYLIIKC